MLATRGCRRELNLKNVPSPSRLYIVPIPPEISFDRYFRGLRPSEQGAYEGKYDLDTVENPNLKDALLRLQRGLNFALGNERSVPEHRDHPPFHMDYVKSDYVNALAFRHDGYSFVGLTMPLIETAFQLCTRLAQSADLLSALGLGFMGKIAEALGAVLFRVMIFFVVSHEYTHIVHGHPLSQADDSMPLNEVQGDDRIADLDAQTLEVDADSYAIYHIMGNYLGGVERAGTVSLLEMTSALVADQDELLFACIVIAIGAYFLLRPVPQLDVESVYKLTHPAQPARLSLLMETAIGWCRQNRPDLERSMSQQRFDFLLSITAGVVWEFDETRNQNWKSQMQFLKTSDGAEYIAKLRKRRDEYRAAL
jgi:hypothetical protein